MNEFTQQIAEALAKHLPLEASEAGAMLEVPPKPDMGDYAFPCFTLAKTLRKAPDKIAVELEQAIELPALVKEIRTAGPYLNFYVDRAEFTKRVLTRAIEQSKGYGNSKKGAGKTVVIDFSSPNIAKPFGIGHLRSTVIGGALYRIFETLGYRVVGVNHLGDWGTQIGKMMAAFARWEDPEKFKENPIAHSYELYTRFHEESGKDPQIEEEARDYFRQLEGITPEEVKAMAEREPQTHEQVAAMGKRKTSNAEQVAAMAKREVWGFWNRFMDVSMAEFKRVYEKLGVHFDYYTGESFYNDRTQATIELLKEKGLVKESEGALVVDLGEDVPPCMLRKADGATLYATRDLAAALYRHDEFNFDLCLYVVGYPQELHFKQFFEVLRLAGFDWSANMHHVPFGHILGMSTRKGTIILLDEVLEEAISRAREVIDQKNPDLENAEEIAQAVGIGAVIFNDLKNSRIKDVNFDWNAILSFDGETGPYVQYAHVRFAGILRHLEGEAPSPASVDLSLLCEPEEWELVRDIENWPSVIEQAAARFEPSEISTHLLRLASDFNRFYQKHRVVGEDAPLTAARISLVLALKNVLSKGLSILGLKALEQM